MKIRNGFVSNSSSSSFLLFKEYLTLDQIKQIRNWKNFCLSDEYKEMLSKHSRDLSPHNTEYYKWDPEGGRVAYHCEPFSVRDYAYYPEGWDVSEGTNVFDFSTDMDNFDMEQFLEVIGVDIDKCGLWIEYTGSYRSTLGLNDARTDLLNYASDRYQRDEYDDRYYYPSKLYKEKIYPILKERYDNQPDNIEPPHPPVEPKKWVCEDAGNALTEVKHKVKELAINERCYCLESTSEGKYLNRDCEIFAKVLEVISEVAENWKTVDSFEQEDDSQRVIAAIEGQGFYNSNVEEGGHQIEMPKDRSQEVNQ